MDRNSLLTEISHSTDMLRATLRLCADANACDMDWLAVEARFWSGNRARARGILAGLGR